MSDEPKKRAWVWWWALGLFVGYPLSAIPVALLDLWLSRRGLSVGPLLVVYWPIWWAFASLGD